MSYCEEKGKDKVIFLTKEDADPSTSTVTLKEDPSDAPVGLITPDGEINWSCPCLGGMAVGPCGQDFRAAFECFHYSTSEQKGAECYEKFAEMQDCMKEYPTLYKEKDPMPDQKEVEAAEAASSLNASETVIENKQGDEQKKELTKGV